MVTLRHTPSGTVVDLAFGAMPFEEEVVKRSRLLSYQDISLRVPTPEDLVIMKAVAQRPSDLIDIQSIAEIHVDLDRKRVEYWLRQYGELLDEPELWDRTEPLLGPRN